jgi:hypothetical protein
MLRVYAESSIYRFCFNFLCGKGAAVLFSPRTTAMSTPLWIEKHRAKLSCTDQVDPLAAAVPGHVAITVLSRKGRLVGRWRHRLDDGALRVRAVLGAMPSVARRESAEVRCYSTAPDWASEPVKTLAPDDVVEWPTAYSGLHDLEEVVVVVDEAQRRQTRRAPASSGRQTRRRETSGSTVRQIETRLEG